MEVSGGCTRVVGVGGWGKQSMNVQEMLWCKILGVSTIDDINPQELKSLFRDVWWPGKSKLRQTGRQTTEEEGAVKAGG